jgi:hypothetical protein
LHEDGFVHGDIRGFNTVFSEKEKAGSLTLILAAGKYNQQLFPPEATNYSDDGMRRENMRSVLQVARLVRIGTIDFCRHSFDPPPTGADNGNHVFLKWSEKLKKRNRQRRRCMS